MGHQLTGKIAIETAEKALSIYDKAISDLVPKLNYPETKRFSDFQSYYSAASGRIVGELQTILMDGDDNFFGAKQSIYNLCGESVPILEGYVDLFDDYNEETAEAQKLLLTEMLDTEIRQLKEAESMIKQTSVKFIDASGKLDELTTQLTADHPKLRATFAEVNKFYADLKTKVTKTINQLDSTEAQLMDATKPVENAKVQVENATFEELSTAVKESTKNAANKFIARCDKYRETIDE